MHQTLTGLLKNELAKYTDLIVYSDYHKTNEEKEGVSKVRKYLRNIKGFKSLTIIKRKQNLGLARSIIGGVSDILKNHEAVIVLEDDIVPSPHFLSYMNEALKFHKNDDTVGSIHAYSYPCSKSLPETFFLRGADCWGWGTWRNSWNLFEKNGQILLEKILDSDLSYDFDLEGAASYTKMLRDQINGKNDSWAIRWHASMFLANKLCLHPGKSLVENIGLDATGTNCLDTDGFNVELTKEQVNPENRLIEESDIAKNMIKEFFIQSKLIK